MALALMWREACSTFTAVVNEIIEQLQPMLDEVRALRMEEERKTSVLTQVLDV